MFKKGIFVVLTLFIKNIGWKIFFYKKKISTYLTKSRYMYIKKGD